jgi:hypothetical protein
MTFPCTSSIALATSRTLKESTIPSGSSTLFWHPTPSPHAAPPSSATSPVSFSAPSPPSTTTPFPWPGLSCPPPSWPNVIKPNPYPLARPNPPHPSPARNLCLHRSSLPYRAERLPIKLSRNLPCSPRPNRPFIPLHRPTPHQLRIISTAAQAASCPPLAPNSLPKFSNQSPPIRRSNPHQARIQVKPQPKRHPNPQTNPQAKNATR